MSTEIASFEQRRGERLLMAVIALAAGAALVLRFGQSAADAGFTGLASATVRNLSYFTIISNLMVALTCGHAALGGAPTSFLARPSVRGAIVVYIVVTGVVYALLLAGTVELHGLAVPINVLLHDVTPILYPLGWLVFGAHGRLQWSDALRWLIVPALYLGWTLARGTWSGEYPYPFVDVKQFGMAAVLRNALGLCVVFAVLGLIVVAIDRGLARQRLPR